MDSYDEFGKIELTVKGQMFWEHKTVDYHETARMYKDGDKEELMKKKTGYIGNR